MLELSASLRLSVLLVAVAAVAVVTATPDPGAGLGLGESVDVFIGSSGAGFGYGAVSPAAQVPFGAMRVGPDTTSTVADAGFQHFSGYDYPDDMVRGFSHTRLVGAGVNDLGTVGLMPSCAARLPLSTSGTLGHEERWWQHFNKTDEVAEPGYYAVQLQECAVQAEMTAGGTHTAVYRFRWSDATEDSGTSAETAPRGKPFLVVDMCHRSALHETDTCREAWLNVDVDANEITGYTLFSGSLSGRSGAGGLPVYLVFKPQRADNVFDAADTVVWENAAEVEDAVGTQMSSTSGSLGAYVALRRTPHQELELAVGMSFVSLEQARANMDAQLGGQRADSLTFDAVRARAAQEWEKMLSVAPRIETEDEDLRTKFYSALYRTFMSPTQYSEAGGVYVGFDLEEHNSEDERAADSFPSLDTEACPSSASRDMSNQFLSDLSLWDTHRTQNPWLLLLRPDVALGVVRSLADMVDQGGDMAVWPFANAYTGCMIGSHGDSVVLDAVVKGYGDYFDTALLYDAMYRQATTQVEHNARKGLDEWLEYGYVSLETSDKAPSLSLTYAFDDWATGRLGEEIGASTEDTDTLMERSKNYANLWDSTREFMCSRTSSGGDLQCPVRPAGPASFQDYTEGDAWQWTFFVPHDPLGLKALFRSDKDFQDKLETFFAKHVDNYEWYGEVLPNEYYWAGNEPDLMAVWFFNYVDPTRTQYWSRQLIDMHFTTGPGGVPGNDDYGTMSAWLAFTTLGLYPFTGTTTYALGSPAVQEATLRVGLCDRELNIVAHDNSEQNVYVSRVLWNGLQLDAPFIDHSELAKGGTLEFFMTSDQDAASAAWSYLVPPSALSP